MKFELGPLAQAMLNGYVFIFNEADFGGSFRAYCSERGIEGKDLYIPENGGMIIKPHPMFQSRLHRKQCRLGRRHRCLCRHQPAEYGSDGQVLFPKSAICRKKQRNRHLHLLFPPFRRSGEKNGPFCRPDPQLFRERRFELSEIPMSTRTLLQVGGQPYGCFTSRNPEEKLYVSFQQALGARYNSTDRQVVCQLARAIFGEAWPAIEH